MFEFLELSQLLHDLDVIKIYQFEIPDKRTQKTKRKRIQKKIKHIINKYEIQHTHHEYERALGNAIHHGKCPVECRLYIGSHHQLVFMIEDHGYGFDYQRVLKQFHKGEVYYHYHGRGTQSYAENPCLCVDWKKKGRQIILYYE